MVIANTFIHYLSSGSFMVFPPLLGKQELKAREFKVSHPKYSDPEIAHHCNLSQIENQKFLVDLEFSKL